MPSSKKKQFPVVAIVTPEGIEGTFTAEQKRPLIAHLPIHSSEVVFYDQPVKYDPTPPCSEITGYNSSENVYECISGPVGDINNYESFGDRSEKKKEDVKVNEGDNGEPAAVEQRPGMKELLIQMKGTNGAPCSLPDNVDVACQWCCHQFTGTPSVIPIRNEANKVWSVYGCFCCPECALAYLIDEKEDSHVRWERISMLHMLYNNGSVTRIYPAPPRNVLKMFGGHYTIQEYRKVISDKKVRVDVHMPPMVSILATMDTKPIDFYETTMKTSFVPINSERVQKAEEGLRLKRSKPLKDKDSTLDSCINLQIRKVTPISMSSIDM
jgi:hypothetical protein